MNLPWRNDPKTFTFYYISFIESWTEHVLRKNFNEMVRLVIWHHYASSLSQVRDQPMPGEDEPLHAYVEVEYWNHNEIEGM